MIQHWSFRHALKYESMYKIKGSCQMYIHVNSVMNNMIIITVAAK